MKREIYKKRRLLWTAKLLTAVLFFEVLPVNAGMFLQANSATFAGAGCVYAATASNALPENLWDGPEDEEDIDVWFATPSNAAKGDSVKQPQEFGGFLVQEPETEEIPAWYSRMAGETVYYGFADRTGERRYRIYGAWGEESLPDWYPCDASGEKPEKERVSLEEEDKTLAPYRYRSVEPEAEAWEELYVSYGETLREWFKSLPDFPMGQNYDGTAYDVWEILKEPDRPDTPAFWFLYGEAVNGDKKVRWYPCDGTGTPYQEQGVGAEILKWLGTLPSIQSARAYVENDDTLVLELNIACNVAYVSGFWQRFTFLTPSGTMEIQVQTPDSDSADYEVHSGSISWLGASVSVSGARGGWQKVKITEPEDISLVSCQLRVIGGDGENSDYHDLYPAYSDVSASVTRARSVELSFDSNGGSAASPSLLTAVKKSTGNAVPVSSRTGYRLDGWFAPDGSSYQGTAPQQDTAYRAGWTPNTYRLIFDYGNGEGDTDEKTVTYDAAYGALPGAAHLGFEFLGWYENENGVREIYAADEYPVSANIREEDLCRILSDQTVYAYYALLYRDNGNGTNSRPGADGIYDTEDDFRYVNGPDGIPGSRDDCLIYPGGDGIRETSDDYYVDDSSGEKIHAGFDKIFGTSDDYIEGQTGQDIHYRPGDDNRFGTEDDEIWWNGPDGAPGTADDRKGLPPSPEDSDSEGDNGSSGDSGNRPDGGNDSGSSGGGFPGSDESDNGTSDFGDSGGGNGGQGNRPGGNTEDEGGGPGTLIGTEGETQVQPTEPFVPQPTVQDNTGQSRRPGRETAGSGRAHTERSMENQEETDDSEGGEAAEESEPEEILIVTQKTSPAKKAAATSSNAEAAAQKTNTQPEEETGQKDIVIWVRQNPAAAVLLGLLLAAGIAFLIFMVLIKRKEEEEQHRTRR